MQKPLLVKKPSRSRVSGAIAPPRKISVVRSVRDCFNLKPPNPSGFRSFDPPPGGEGVLDPADREAAAVGGVIAAKHCRWLPVAAVAETNGGIPCRS